MGYAAGRAGARRSAQEETQEQRLAGLESQQAASQQVPADALPARPASSENTIDQLQKLAQLRDSGVLTPAEFEAQKQKILATGG